MLLLFRKLLIGALLVTSFTGIADKHSVEEGYLAEFDKLGIQTIYYNVSGQTAKEIRAALDKTGPIDKNGRRGDAYTAWKISWKWGFKNGQPDFLSTNIAHEISVTLPKWTEYDAAPKELQKNWATFISALVKHEKQHVDYVLKHKDQIPKNIIAAFRKDNRLTQDQANAIAREVLAKIRNLDRSYDLRTLHGRSEGVRFP